MAGISTSLNALLATNFSDLGRIGQGVNGAYKASHPQSEDLKNKLGNLREGSTVSARYDYRVGANGQLVSSGSEITTSVGDEEQKRQRQAYTQPDERQQSFSDLLKPKAQLSPADELALFSDGAVATDAGSPQSVTIRGGAQEADGTSIDIELLAPGRREAANAPAQQSLAAQRQQQVSNLYARNFDLSQAVLPQIAFAA